MADIDLFPECGTTPDVGPRRTKSGVVPAPKASVADLLAIAAAADVLARIVGDVVARSGDREVVPIGTAAEHVADSCRARARETP
jgi:hypothetical protein